MSNHTYCVNFPKNNHCNCCHKHSLWNNVLNTIAADVTISLFDNVLNTIAADVIISLLDNVLNNIAADVTITVSSTMLFTLLQLMFQSVCVTAR